MRATSYVEAYLKQLLLGAKNTVHSNNRVVIKFVLWAFRINVSLTRCLSSVNFTCRNREILELGLDNEDSEHENDEDTNQSKAKKNKTTK